MATEEKRVRDFGLIFYLWFILVIAAYGFGIYSIWQLTGAHPELMDWVVSKFGQAYTYVQDYIWWAVLVVAVLFVAGILIAYFEVWMMSYLGAEIVNSVIFGVPLLLLGAGIYAIIKVPEIWIGIVILAPAVFLIFIILLLARRVILGAKIFEMSNEAVNEQKGTLGPVFFFAITSVLTIVTGVAGSIYAGSNLDEWLTSIGKTANWIEYLVFFIIIYVYLAIHWTMLYFSDAVNICMFKRWNNYKDASIRIAIREIWKVKGSIVLFGMFMAFFDAIIKTIQYFAQKQWFAKWKKSKAWTTTMKVLSIIFIVFIWILRWLFKILKFLNYYTLTIIVVEKQGFIRSVIRSADLSVDSAADIIIGKAGVNIAKGLFTLMTFGIFSTGGFFLGYYWLSGLFSIPVGSIGGVSYQVLFSLAVAAVFFFFGYLPTTAILRPISTAYKTILFFNIVDPFRDHPGRKTRVSGDVQRSLDKVKEDVMLTYDKEERPTWAKPAEAET